MQQIKLSTFFSIVYFLLLALMGGYFYYNFQEYKHQHAVYTSQRAIAVIHGLESTIIPIASINQLYLLKPIIDSIPQHRSFLQSVSLSLNNNVILYSSDSKLIGHALPNGIYIKNDSIASDILAGKKSYLLPITYTTNSKQLHGTLLLILTEQSLLSDDFLTEIYINFAVFSIVLSFILGIIFWIIRHYLVVPLQNFDSLINNEFKEKPTFLISDLSIIYNELTDSYKELDQKEKSLENALAVKDYLYEILHSMDLINRLLISDKSIQEIMSDSCNLLAKHGQYHLAWIGNIVDDQIDIVAHSDDSTGYVAQLQLSLNPDDPTSQGPSAQSIITNQTVITQSMNLDYYKLWKEKAQGSGHGSSICLPLRGSANDKPFATMAIYSIKPFGFIDEEITMLEDLAGDIGYAISSRIKKAELAIALTTDPLTGLPNRARLMETLHHCDHPKLLLININRFRDINTVYGFDAGDFILRSCAECLNKNITLDIGKVFRFHSDTFAILMEPSYTSSSTEILVKNLSLNLVDNPISYNGIDIWLTIAAGYSDTVEETIENGEIALKKAKELKIPFLQFSPAMRMNKEHEENIAWYKIIKDAIKENRVVPFYQVIVNNENGEKRKFEALIRIILKDGTVISPYKFLDIAKKTGLYTQLTKIMITKTIETFKDSPHRVSINLSTEDITNTDTVEFLRESIIHSSIGQKIVFEILESEGIDNYDQVSEFITEFKKLGCQFAIDDFGSGFSNFDHLIKLQVDFLKIDGSLIKNITHDKNAQVIVKNIHNFASEMGIATIAEFVSSKEIAEFVKEIGITYSQGYYFSEPTKVL